MGIGLAEPGFATACYVEIEDYPRRTLIEGQRAGYLHTAPIWDDLKLFSGRPWRGKIDTLLAGYPCQPFSQAGQRKGEKDPRHLFPDIERIIEELGDGLRWCFFENVQGHITLGLETVVRSLRRMGFSVAAGLFSAEETGTTHERQRIFIVAYRQSLGAEPRRLPLGTETTFAGPRLDEGKLADGHDPGSQGQLAGIDRAQGRQEQAGHARLRGGTGLHPPGPAELDVWRHVLAFYPDGAPALSLGDLSAFSRYFAALIEAGELSQAEAERRLCRMADGLASRARGLRLLGNGVHPLAAAYAWRTLSAAHGLGCLDLGTGETDQSTDAARAALTV